jgi:hypothetical protein
MTADVHPLPFAERLSCVAGRFGPGSSDPLKRASDGADADLGGARRLFFLSVPPVAVAPVVRGLGEADLPAGHA